MSAEKINEVILQISGAFIRKEEAVQDYNLMTKATLDELRSSVDIVTAEDCKQIKKVAEEMGKGKFDELKSASKAMQKIIEIKVNQ